MTIRPRFAVVTDSASDIPPALARSRGIRIVPLPVIVGDDTFDDGTITQEELFRRMERAAPGSSGTSQPSPGALGRAYDQALEDADEVIAVHISSRLSGTCDLARTVARQFEGRVHVFDSRNLSWGMGWQVMEACDAAADGASAAVALARLERAREETSLVVTLDSLAGLNRSGRIGAVATHLGSLLHLKVSVAVNSAGAFVPVRGNRGNRAATSAMLEWVAQRIHDAGGGSFAVGHVLARERADALAAAVRERWRVDEFVMYEAGSAISVHAGTIWGVAVRPRFVASR